MMLAQLLAKHGFGTRVVPFEAVSRAEIGALDTSAAQMICISYLEISGTPAHLRYLVQRVRRRAPEAQVLVGLWPADDAVLSDPGARKSLGADHYAISLREGVEACLEAVRDVPAAAPSPAPAQEARDREVHDGSDDKVAPVPERAEA